VCVEHGRAGVCSSERVVCCVCVELYEQECAVMGVCCVHVSRVVPTVVQ
jgi:hypothetical protein